jgi:hypothetical protein
MLYTTGIGTHEPLVCLFVAIFGTGMVSTAAIVIVILIRAVAPTTRAQSSEDQIGRCSDQVEDEVLKLEFELRLDAAESRRRLF